MTTVNPVEKEETADTVTISGEPVSGFEKVFGSRWSNSTNFPANTPIAWNGGVYTGDGVGGFWDVGSTLFTVNYTGVYAVNATLTTLPFNPNTLGQLNMALFRNSVIIDFSYYRGLTGYNSMHCKYYGPLTAGDNIRADIQNASLTIGGSPFNTVGWNHLTIVRIG